MPFADTLVWNASDFLPFKYAGSSLINKALSQQQSFLIIKAQVLLAEHL